MMLVRKMHDKFQLSHDDGPRHLDADESTFRVKAMQEELDEYRDADNLVEKYDALLDLLIFTIGTLHRHGFPLLEGFQVVMGRNMMKELAGSAEASKRGFARDLIKPAGWTGPETELEMIIAREMNKVLDSANAAVAAEDGNAKAKKFDDGKIPVDLLPVSSLMKMAEVLGFGVKKYGRENWRAENRPNWSRVYASIQRHLMAFWSGQDIDPDSGLEHLAHAGTQIAMLLYYVQANPELDDRFKEI